MAQVVEILSHGKQGPFNSTVDTILTDDLVTCGARASSVVILTLVLVLPKYSGFSATGVNNTNIMHNTCNTSDPVPNLRLNKYMYELFRGHRTN